MFKNKFLLPVIALLSLSACSGNNVISSVNPINDDPAFKAHEITKPQRTFNNKHQNLSFNYVESLKAFSLDFYKVVPEQTNPVFSPISLATCYSMLYDGALEETKEELKNMLHYDDSFNHLEEIQKMLLNTAINNKNTTLDMAQSLWIHDRFANNLNEEYFNNIQDYYFAEAYQGILESDVMHRMLADYINTKTHDFLKVKKETFDEYEGILWLLNTIYLKSTWINTFPEKENYKSAFLNIDKSSADNVEYMHHEFESNYYKADNYMISSIPYCDNLSMTILLPNEGTDYKKVLNDETALNDLLNYYNSRNHMTDDVTYVLPKFKTQSAYDLIEILPELGIEYAIDPDKANLFGLCKEIPDVNLYVKRSRHEAGIEVKNDGTVAAAYTIIEVDEKAAPAPSIRFVCDRPFTYIINTNDGLPLFMGTVNKF